MVQCAAVLLDEITTFAVLILAVQILLLVRVNALSFEKKKVGH